MTDTKVKQAQPNQIQVGFHYGRTLLHLASTYARPNQVILELVQNAIDAGAFNISIKIDGRKRNIYCADDGVGESFENLQHRFQRISEQQKKGKIGHKGIGNLAALAIGEGSVLTTRPRGSRQRFYTVALNREKLEEMADEVALPCRREPKGFRPGAQFKLGTDFAISTLLVVKGVRTAAMKPLKEAATIAQTIENRFAPQILKRKIRILVEAGGHKTQVQPAAFPGTPEKTEIETPHGTVVFDIYSSPKAEKKPRLAIVHGKTPEEHYSVPFAPFLEVSEPIGQVFGSGLLQGNIYLPFCKITPDRDEFEYDDQLIVFWEILEEYAQTYGRQIIDRISQERKEIKIFRVINSAIQRLNRYVMKHKEEFAGIFVGQVSLGHVGAGTGIEGETIRTLLPKPRASTTQPRPASKEPTREQKKRVHSGLKDPTGTRRRVVNRQTGIVADWRPPHPEEGRDWRSKFGEGIIVFNSLHPDWQKVESNQEAHIQYVFHLMLKELVLSRLEDSRVRDDFNDVFENDYIASLVETFAL